MYNEFKKRLISSLIIIPVALFFIIKGSVFFMFFLGVFFLATSYEWLKMNKKKTNKFLGILYLLFAFYSAYLLREKISLALFILTIVICISTDLGGYVFGKIFKGPKLTKISPNKTYAGMIGSFVVSIIVGSIFIGESKFIIYVPMFLENELNYILITLFISSVSQVGDLIVSYFKRLAKVKDTGKILPGHGGLLDRVDGIIFAIPASFLLFNFLR